MKLEWRAVNGGVGMGGLTSFDGRVAWSTYLFDPSLRSKYLGTSVQVVLPGTGWTSLHGPTRGIPGTGRVEVLGQQPGVNAEC